ncbi:MAG: hypothetical protein J3R72DRAFT_477125 [Linnemannia gamsii]|nr:MAG: hypothetical protein J3R72DRAFT_477125 [Linnemannia gamsii]
MQVQGRAQAVYPVDLNGLSPNTGVAPTFTDMAYISTYLDPSAGMEVMFWRDIRAMFIDAVYVRHNSRTLDFLKDANGKTLVPLRVASLHRAVMEIVVDAPLNPSAAHVQGRVVPPPTPRPAPPDEMHRRPPLPPHSFPRPPLPPTAQLLPRPTARVLDDDDTDTDIPHHIHIAKHEGYDLQRLAEFSRKYGRYMLTLLEMIKHGSTSAGFFVPASSSVNFSGATDMLTNSQDSITPSAINQSIEYLQAFSSEQDAAKDTIADSFTRLEALEGADLRYLEEFTKSKDQDRALGNLYRTITEEGHVRWVCINHYRLAYTGQDQQAFVTAIEFNGGHYNPHLGRVTVSLESKIQTAGFYEALAKARRIDELIVTFGLESTTSDLEAFGDTLKNTGVSILRLDLRRLQTCLPSILQSIHTLQQALARCINLPSMKIIHIVLPLELFELCSLQPKRLSFPPKLSFEVMSRQGGVRLEKNGPKRLAEILKINSTLTALDLSYNSIGDNGTVALSEALKTNSTLTILKLLVNSISNDGAVELSEVLKTNSTLSTLDISYNSIGDNGTVALSEALKANSTLTSLGLRSNTIRENGAVALSEAIKTNSTLTTLHLSLNPIGDNGTVVLSEALKTNSTLTTLDISYNSIGDNGTVALSEALKVNSTLTALDLSYNLIGKSGAEALSEALKVNSTLTTLDLAGNSIGRRELWRCLKHLRLTQLL